MAFKRPFLFAWLANNVIFVLHPFGMAHSHTKVNVALCSCWKLLNHMSMTDTCFRSTHRLRTPFLSCCQATDKLISWHPVLTFLMSFYNFISFSHKKYFYCLRIYIAREAAPVRFYEGQWVMISTFVLTSIIPERKVTWAFNGKWNTRGSLNPLRLARCKTCDFSYIVEIKRTERGQRERWKWV